MSTISKSTKPMLKDSSSPKRLSTRSAKAKGRRLQDQVRERLLKTFPNLDPLDIKTAIMGESGMDIHLSPAARKTIPLAIECKNVEKINIWAAIEQSMGAVKKDGGKLEPCVVFKRNHSKTYICLDFDFLLYLLSNQRK